MSYKCHYCGGNAELIGKNWDNEDVFRCKKCGKQGRDDHFSDRPTVFNRITVSPEVLAEEFVGMMYDRVSGEDKYYSMLTGEFYGEYVEAITATVAKLKEWWNE